MWVGRRKLTYYTRQGHSKQPIGVKLKQKALRKGTFGFNIFWRLNCSIYKTIINVVMDTGTISDKSRTASSLRLPNPRPDVYIQNIPLDTPGIRSNILDLISETINLCLKHSTVNQPYLLEFLHSYAERTSLFVSKVTHQWKFKSWQSCLFVEDLNSRDYLSGLGCWEEFSSCYTDCWSRWVSISIFFCQWMKR